MAEPNPGHRAQSQMRGLELSRWDNEVGGAPRHQRGLAKLRAIEHQRY